MATGAGVAKSGSRSTFAKSIWPSYLVPLPLFFALSGALRLYRSSTLACFASAVVLGGLNYGLTTLILAALRRMKSGSTAIRLNCDDL